MMMMMMMMIDGDDDDDDDDDGIEEGLLSHNRLQYHIVFCIFVPTKVAVMF